MGAALDDYLARVARVLERRVPERLAGDAPRPGYPRPRERRLEVAEIRVGLIDFLSLHRCDLGALVGRRNSSLGRVMTASQRLYYEHRFLREARRCVEVLRRDGEREGLAAELAQIVARKREALPRVAWNATFGGPVFAGLFPRDAQPLPLQPHDAPATGRGALLALAEVLAALGERPLPRKDWEAPFARLDGVRFGGRLRASMAALTAHLRAVAEWVDARGAERPICLQGRPSRKARVLERIFRQHYAGVVQPYLARVHRVGRAWLDALEAVRAAVDPAPPPAFRRWWAATLARDGERSEWQRFEAAIRRHTLAWQDLLERCGLTPKPPAAGPAAGGAAA